MRGQIKVTCKSLTAVWQILFIPLLMESVLFAGRLSASVSESFAGY